MLLTAGLALGTPTAADAYDPDLLCAVPWHPGPGGLDEIPMCRSRSGTAAARGNVDARAALTRARELAEAGRPRQAILWLRVVAEAEPRLADRFALEEAGYRMAAGADGAACEAFARAARSPHRSVALLAEIGQVRCQLSIGSRAGVDGFESLRRRYPELTVEHELRFLLGRAHERWGEGEEAGRVYRHLDLMAPGSVWARDARARIGALLAAGVDVRPMTAIQEVDRADRLVSTGPMDAAREEIARLRAAPLSRPLAQQVARSAAQIARVEGRFEEAAALLREAAGQPDLEPEEREALTARMHDLEQAATTLEAEEVRRRIRALTRGSALDRLTTGRAFAVLRMAGRAGLRPEVDAAVRSILRSDRMPPGVCFDAAILAAGTGSDEGVAELFERASRRGRLRVAARYHHARTLERLGRTEAAREEYRRVIEEDSTSLPFYAMWARQRLRATAHVETPTPEPIAMTGAASRPAMECRVGPFTLVPVDGAAKAGEGEAARRRDLSCTLPRPENPYVEPPPVVAPTLAPSDPLAEADEAARQLEAARSQARPAPRLGPEQIAALLEPVAREHGEAYPWLPRALALVRLGELSAASDELHEAYTAYRDASGGSSLRAGLLGVLRGGAPPRHRVSGGTWRARRQLGTSARATLARVSAALGDHGLAIRLDGFGVSGARPRAYADLVEAAARRHGVEPELLFAVMRVESVYNPRIISYAGAIGLMQIMPRTGRLIASARGMSDFTVDRLLDPATNIDFAAWYLASLVERFDGRIPLAVASYNGGPHNVRRWMHSYGPDMPLEAFLERIEFSQTHRYVRRVLTHYEAYRAQRGLSMTRLDVTLPELEADLVAF